MIIYAVWVQPEIGKRYIDTLWVREESADERVEELATTFKHFAAKHTCWRQTATLQDGSLPGDKKPEATA
jgi:hypothetical protein